MYREHWDRLKDFVNWGRDVIGQVGAAGKLAGAAGLAIAVSLALVFDGVSDGNFDGPAPSSQLAKVAPGAGPVAAMRVQTSAKPLIMESSGLAVDGLSLGNLRDTAEPADKVFAELRNAKRGFSHGLFTKAGNVNVMVVTNNAVKLHQTFRSMGYHLERVRSGEQTVPRLFMASLPADLPRLNSVQTRKAVFIKTILPLILRANEDILRQRRRLIVLKERIAKGKTLSSADSLWLETLAGRYDVANRNIKELLNRVDVIPPSLALAQAAEESGWGTSRFAQEGNAIFGQRTTKEFSGIVPKGASGKHNIKVRSFGKLYDGISSYVRNLNVHRAYRHMRKARAKLRRRGGEGAEFNGMDLTRTLGSYSERGEAYVRTIQSIMRYNNFNQFDTVRLSNKAAFLGKYSGT